MSKRTKKFQKISEKLSPHLLRQLEEKELSLESSEFFVRNAEKRSSPYFLGYYSKKGIKYALEKYGFFEAIRAKGFSDLQLTVNTQDPYRQRLALHYRQKDADHLLGELVVRKSYITLKPAFPSNLFGRHYETIVVEWLSMQNPLGRFSAKKPQLPGQQFPGLGMGDMAMEILIIMSRRLKTDGLVNRPEHFHNAQMYSSKLRYLDPEQEARRQAISRDLLSKYSLADVSWAIDLKCVTENNILFHWQSKDQIVPIHKDLLDYFQSREYKKTMIEMRERLSYDLIESKWQDLKGSLKKQPTC